MGLDNHSMEKPVKAVKVREGERIRPYFGGENEK